MPKAVLEKFNFNEIKIEKVKFFTQNPTKIPCISIFNSGGCLASCLTFRPFLFNVKPLATSLLIKKRVYIHAFTAERFLEVAIESWPEWDLNQQPLNSVQTL